METEKKQTDEKKELRTGFTTGTCAAACTRAAVLFLCTGEAPAAAETVTPSGVRAILPIVRAEREEDSAVCGVQKDSGDDPDVTNGTLVCARAVLACHDSITESGYTDPAYPGIEVTGGEGIGMVTRDGLSCPVGHYAINPVPRTAIFREAALARREAGMPEIPLRIEISIPSGRELAEKTFNPHLGIIGGISVLGTTGIVNPMSEAALVETIRLDIRVHAQEDVSLLAVAPGNYGERFLKEETGLSMENFIKCSNFIGTSFKMLSQEGIHQALLAGHVGKLVKVAGGVMNTHSRYGDRRMEILSACARTVGFPEADALLPMNTTEEAADFLYEHGYLKQVMEQVANQVKALQTGWSERGISFEDSSARLISVVLHDRFSDTDNTLFIGHVGVLLPAEDGSLYFIEKVAFQEPYRLVKIQNRTELSDYLMEKYDTAWGQDTTRSFIMENDELMDGYRPNPLDSAS